MASFAFQNSYGVTNKNDIHYEDIINLVNPTRIKFSDSGSQVAFVVKKGDLGKNKNIEILYIHDIKNNQTKKIYESDAITHVIWIGENLYFSAQEKNKFKIIAYKNGKFSVLLSSDEPINLFSFSSDGSNLYYTTSKRISMEKVKKRMEEGYVYSWDRGTAFDKISQAEKEYETAWKYNFKSRKTTELLSFPYGGFAQSINIIPDLALSETGRFLALLNLRSGDIKKGETPFKSDIIVFDDNTSQKIEPPQKIIGNVNHCFWINPNTLFFSEERYTPKDILHDFWLWDIASKKMIRLDWINIQERHVQLFYAAGNIFLIGKNSFWKILLKEKKLEKISFKNDLLPMDSWSSVIDFSNQMIGFSAENTTNPPEIMVYDLSKNTLLWKTTLNKNISHLNLGKVEKLKITVDKNISSTGYLIYPSSRNLHAPYPLIIATYGFSDNKFIIDGQWHSSFPAQILAQEGYLVLLLNRTAESIQVSDGKRTSEQERKELGYNNIPLFEKAVDLLVEKGLADSKKIGLYGWSHGAFLVNFLITHSQKFQVASLGEGGDYNPSGFWYGKAWQDIYDLTFGGPPFGKTLKNYLDFSPFFNADKINTPVLFEFVAEGAITGLEMYSTLRYQKIPAELVAYEGEEHNFIKPKSRIASMKRKVQWFDYWLLGRKDKDPDFSEQYLRWDAMKKTWQPIK